MTEVQVEERDYVAALGQMAGKLADAELRIAVYERVLKELHSDLPTDSKLLQILEMSEEGESPALKEASDGRIQ